MAARRLNDFRQAFGQSFRDRSVGVYDTIEQNIARVQLKRARKWADEVIVGGIRFTDIAIENDSKVIVVSHKIVIGENGSKAKWGGIVRGVDCRI